MGAQSRRVLHVRQIVQMAATSLLATTHLLTRTWLTMITTSVDDCSWWRDRCARRRFKSPTSCSWLPAAKSCGFGEQTDEEVQTAAGPLPHSRERASERYIDCCAVVCCPPSCCCCCDTVTITAHAAAARLLAGAFTSMCSLRYVRVSLQQANVNSQWVS